jgi:D-threonine aldolase
VKVTDLATPALVVDAAALEHNLSVMAEALPGTRLRPHVKAHKCSELAKEQLRRGPAGLTCSTIREVDGLVAAGIKGEFLLANEVLDATRLGELVAGGASILLAVDSEETLTAAIDGGVRQIVLDVNVGLPRCGIAPQKAGALAYKARKAGLDVRGVMGYEGHVTAMEVTKDRQAATATAMELLATAAADVGGEIISAGATANFHLNTVATEIQAGSYVFMDSAYGRMDLPFRQALHILATVISVNPRQGYAVADAGLKAMAMDHGNPEIDGSKVWFLSDEHTTFSSEELPVVGDRIRLTPGHIDPTVAYHDRIHILEGDRVVDTWPVDLRGW